jgi:hypothetical protein
VLDDVQHVLEGQRLEVQAVGGVVVGRHGLRVGVDHDRLEAGLAQRPHGVDGGVVELDALTDAVRSRAEDDDLPAVGGADLVLPLVGGVVVRGVGLELGGAGVDRLEDRHLALGEAPGAHAARLRAGEPRDVGVGEAEPLGLAPGLPLPRGRVAERRHLALRLDDLAQLRQEPRVDGGLLVQQRHAAAAAQQLDDRAEALRVAVELGLEGASSASANAWRTSSSSERIAFCSDSLNVRPIAMTSPTERIWVPRASGCRGTSRTRSAGSWSPRSRSTARRRPSSPW